MKKLQFTSVHTGSRLTSGRSYRSFVRGLLFCHPLPCLSGPETSKQNHGDCAPSHRTVWFQRQMSGKQRRRDVVVSGPEAGVSEGCLSRKKIHLA